MDARGLSSRGQNSGCGGKFIGKAKTFSRTAFSTARLLCTLATARALAMSSFPAAPAPAIEVEVYSDLA